MTMPSFRSSAEAAQASGTTLTISKPAGTVDGDFLLAYIKHMDTSTPTITPPAGWTALFDDVVLAGGGASVEGLYYKFASSEGASYAFSVSDSAVASVGHITCWQNVHATTPITDLGYSAEANSLADPTAWAAYANSVAIAFMGATGVVDATPSGFTQREKTTQGATTCEIATVSKDIATAGYVGAAYTALANTENGGILVLHGVGETNTSPSIAGWRHVPDTGSTTILDKPIYTVDRDLLVLVAIDSTAKSAFTLPGGWTTGAAHGAFYGSFGSIQSWYKVASSEAATYTISWTTSTNDVEWFLLRIIDPNATTAVAGTEVASVSSSTSLAFTGISGILGTGLAVVIAVDESATAPSWTPPSGFTEQMDAAALMDTTDCLGIFTMAVTSSTGAVTATGTGTTASDDKIGLLFVVNGISTSGRTHQMVL
jgi:hypothetical protein